jgi:hypothetical protein
MPKNANPLTACLLARGSPLLRVFPTLSVLTFFSNQIIYHLSGDQTENFTAQTMDALVGKDFFWRIQEHIRNIQDFCKYREELKKEEEHIPDTETAAKLEMEMKAIDMVRRIDKFMRWATLFRSSFKMARRVVALVKLVETVEFHLSRCSDMLCDGDLSDPRIDALADHHDTIRSALAALRDTKGGA